MVREHWTVARSSSRAHRSAKKDDSIQKAMGKGFTEGGVKAESERVCSSFKSSLWLLHREQIGAKSEGR